MWPMSGQAGRVSDLSARGVYRCNGNGRMLFSEDNEIVCVPWTIQPPGSPRARSHRNVEAHFDTRAGNRLLGRYLSYFPPLRLQLRVLDSVLVRVQFGEHCPIDPKVKSVCADGDHVERPKRR
jgi:hypothetical protein